MDSQAAADYEIAALAGDLDRARALIAEHPELAHDADLLYHVGYAPDPAFLRMMLEGGADPRDTGAVGASVDGDHLEHVRLLLEAGADPNERNWAYVVHAVRRGCGPQMVRLLVEHGADVDRLGGEWSTPSSQYRSAYANAVLRNNDELVAVLAELGASTTVDPGDLVVAAVARGERPSQPLPDELVPDAQEALIMSVLHGNVDLVVELLGPDFFGHVGGGPAGALLHHACWTGNAGLVAELLARGADPVIASGAEFDTPVAWAALGSQDHELDGRDYVGCVEQLAAAGAEVTGQLADVAQGPLADWFSRRA